tara:strand:+ start:649 stop:831 length:183 start_codon:yes stop_codon:yes gene_type:complete
MYGEIIVNDYILNNRFKIIVKPNSKKTEILGYDKDKKPIKIPKIPYIYTFFNLLNFVNLF